MSEPMPLEPEVELEPTCLDTAIIMGLLVAWCVAFIIGIVQSNVMLAGGSFIFLLLAIGVRAIGKKVPYDTSEDYSSAIAPDQWVKNLRWLRDKFALLITASIAIVVMITLYILLMNYPHPYGFTPRFDKLYELLHVAAIVAAGLTVIVFGIIADGLWTISHETPKYPSCILSLAAFLLVAFMFPAVLCALVQLNS